MTYLRFPVFAINMLTTLGYRKVDHGKGTFKEQTVQSSTGSSSTTRTAPVVGPLSFAKPYQVASRGVMINVSRIHFVAGFGGITAG